MNITPQAPNLSTPTVLNPHTETLRRENNQREVISQPAALNQLAAEKGVASDKERGRTPAQNSENIDFISLKEKAELANSAVSDQHAEQNKDHNGKQGTQQGNQQNDEQSESASSKQESNNKTDKDNHELDHQQAQEIKALQQRDQEVRSHELAHASVGGSFTGTPSYSFETGPDGQRYAVEGEVSIDLSSISGDPVATIAKMQKVHAAALAPADPSAQDIKVAASASQIILQAQSELLAIQKDNSAPEYTHNTSGINNNNNKTLAEDNEVSSEQDFDTLINKTLEAQEKIAPSRSNDVIQRAGRIERFYSSITQAYQKPANYQFELTA